MTETTCAERREAPAEAERPDPGGVVRRGAAAESVEFGRTMAEGPVLCCVGGRSGALCGREAVMEVWGLEMCGAHGEEAAGMALEEIAFDLERIETRLTTHEAGRLSPHQEAAFSRVGGVLPDEALEYEAHDAALLAAFPIRDRSRVDPETLGYVEGPPRGAGNAVPPSEVYRGERVTLARLMRLAFEGGAEGAVEALESLRALASEQCAYALALEAEAGLRDGVPDEAGGGAE